MHAYIASKFLGFSWILKTKILDKISVQIFKPTPPGEGGIKNEVIEKSLGKRLILLAAICCPALVQKQNLQNLLKWWILGGIIGVKRSWSGFFAGQR